MYKKVTHTIVEEHFSHPMAGEIKEALDKKVIPPKYKLEQVSPEKFKSDINNYLSRLNIRFQDIFKSIDALDETALADVEKNMFAEIDALGDMYKTYYGIEFGERFNQYMRTAVLLLIAIARNLKNKMDIRDWRIRLDNTKFDISNLFYAYNNVWRLPDTQALFGQIFNELITEAQAVVNKDSAGAAKSAESLNRMLSILADTLANGTVQQFPGKFITA